MKKTLSLLLALAMIVSAAIATAESTATGTEETVTADTEETAAAVTYSLDEMLNNAIADAYARQAAYAAYAGAFPDSRSIAALDIHTQIVLLEMLVKAHGIALPAAAADVTVPETQNDAYQAIAEAESNAVTMMKAYLKQEALTEDAQMIFRSVLGSSRQNVATFASKVRAAKRAEEWEALWNGADMQKYVIKGTQDKGKGSWTVYIVTNDPDKVPEGAQLVDDSAADTATETTTESVTETTGN